MAAQARTLIGLGVVLDFVGLEWSVGRRNQVLQWALWWRVPFFPGPIYPLLISGENLPPQGENT